MSSGSHKPPSVHLVGSIPLQGASEVFCTVNDTLGPRISRIPDGETGQRTNWILLLEPILEQCPWLIKSPQSRPDHLMFEPKAKTDLSEYDLPSFGYSHYALKSFQTFQRLKQQGKLQPHLRFQVSLPSPLAITMRLFAPGSQAALYTKIKDHLLRELNQILDGIPHRDLAIQWDLAYEFAVLELGLPPPLSVNDSHTNDLDKLVHEIKSISGLPDQVEMGYHLCYGDLGHRHFKEPADLGFLVKVANHLSANASRQIDWIHMPVPRSRTDGDYFKPLVELKVSDRTRIFLGLVHLSDGLDGAMSRILAAKRFSPVDPVDFGVSTECGFGRRPPESIQELLKLHCTVADYSVHGNEPLIGR